VSAAEAGGDLFSFSFGLRQRRDFGRGVESGEWSRAILVLPVLVPVDNSFRALLGYKNKIIGVEDRDNEGIKNSIRTLKKCAYIE
jgi:hypothetical protein